MFGSPLHHVGLRRFWDRVGAEDITRYQLGERHYYQLLNNHPELLEYFAKSDMDSLASHLASLIDLMIEHIGIGGGSSQSIIDHVGEIHRNIGIPMSFYPIIGGRLLKTLRPFLEEEEEYTRELDVSFTAKKLEEAFAMLYLEVMDVVSIPMIVQEKLVGGDLCPVFISNPVSNKFFTHSILYLYCILLYNILVWMFLSLPTT